MFRYIVNKYVQTLHEENKSTLMREIKEDLKNEEMFMIMDT